MAVKISRVVFSVTTALSLGLAPISSAHAQEPKVEVVKENKKVQPQFFDEEAQLPSNAVVPSPAKAMTPSAYYSSSPDFKPMEKSGEWTPEEEALRQARQEEVRQMRLAEEKERKELELRQNSEEKRADLDLQTLRHRKQSREFRIKSEQAQENIDLLKREVMEIEAKQKDVTRELADVEQRFQQEMAAHQQVSGELNEIRGKLQTSVRNLARSRDEVQSRVYKAQLEMQKFRSEIAKDETDISRVKNDHARLDAEELRVRTEWADLADRSRELHQERQRVIAEMEDQQRHLNGVRKDYNIARRESDELEREVRDLNSKAAREKAAALAQMRQLDQNIVEANNQKARLEAEKVRIAAETEKLKDQLVAAQQTHEKVVAEAQSSEGMVMETRLAFETARSDLTKETNQISQVKLESDTRRVQARNLASLAESSGMLESQASAEVVQNCRLRSEPSFKASVVAEVRPGTRVIASEEGGDWVKVLNSSGSAQYIRKSCVKYSK